MGTSLRALNRFGLGARIGERQVVGDGKGWLRSQLKGDPPVIDAPSSMDDVAEALDLLREVQRTRDEGSTRSARQRVESIRTSEMRAMLERRVATDRPFLERLVAFWSNHLCVSMAASRQVAALAGHYERTAIRPHVLGKFQDMVLASAKHPAMLFYLNNLVSIGPGSRAGRQSSRRGVARGLNENYARELLELHTVGVDGGYEQTDVEQLARILTGWTVGGVGPLAREGEGIGFAFRPALHEPGDKTVMGERYREAGVQEGERVIRYLCAQPSTAAFIARKLAVHFVSDHPAQSAVAHIADVFLNSEGDLREVSMALVDLEDAWVPENRKFRTPQDWVTALLRAVGAREAWERVGPLLYQLRHTPWAPAAPKGYGDARREWADPDALMNRAELARSVAGRLARTGRLDPSRLLEVMEVDEGDPIQAMLADDTISAQERIALAFGGPAFQWR
jgi:uncharacterized protein (DUF1800 family)